MRTLPAGAVRAGVAVMTRPWWIHEPYRLDRSRSRGETGAASWFVSCFQPMSAESAPLSYAEFERVDIRVGRVVAVEAFPEARKPAYKLRIDFGAHIGVRKSSAQATRHYTKDDLVGRL